MHMAWRMHGLCALRIRTSPCMCVPHVYEAVLSLFEVSFVMHAHFGPRGVKPRTAHIYKGTVLMHIRWECPEVNGGGGGDLWVPLDGTHQHGLGTDPSLHTPPTHGHRTAVPVLRHTPHMPRYTTQHPVRSKTGLVRARTWCRQPVNTPRQPCVTDQWYCADHSTAPKWKARRAIARLCSRPTMR